jgi:trk system potassium uptake protein TrkA
MKFLIVGAGQVGRSVAESLAAEHEIVVMDFDSERLDDVRSRIDAMTTEGDGTNLEALQEINADEFDTVVASTGNDQTNILVCNTVRALNPSIRTIARVEKTAYFQSWRHSPRAFNVSFMVGEDYLTAMDIYRVSGLPSARNVELFAGGGIEMAEFPVSEETALAGRSVREIDRYEGLTFAAVVTEDTMEIARGNTTVPADSRLVVIGRPRSVRKFGKQVSGQSEQSPIERVMILGGGEIGRQTAEFLLDRNIEPKLVESDPERAEFLAKDLPETLVLNDDAMDPDFLRQEGIPRIDLLISAMHPDERNLLTSTIGRQLGAERILSVVHDQKYKSYFENADVDVVVNPREAVIEEILQYIRGPNVEKIAFVEHHQGEVLEVVLPEESPLVDRPLKESMAEFPDQLVIGALSRNGRIIIPRGDTVPEAGDHVVLFAKTEAIDEVLETLW